MQVSRPIAISACVASLAAAAPALAAAPLSGNQQAIAVARADQRAFAGVPALTQSVTGEFAMNDAEGRNTFFDWSWKTGVVPKGWVRASANELFALNRGHIVWARIDLIISFRRFIVPLAFSAVRNSLSILSSIRRVHILLSGALMATAVTSSCMGIPP